MKKILTIPLLIAAATFSSYGQMDMGDAELNGWLTTIVSNAKVHFSEFRSFITSSYDMSTNKYDYLTSEVGMNVGDIYLTAVIAKVSKRSLDDVITAYKRNKAKGWGAIAKDFGVSPGTPAFEALKDHAYKKANGTSRPKPKPIVASKPATKSTKTTTKQSTKKSATKPTTKSTSTTKPKAKTTSKPKS